MVQTSPMSLELLQLLQIYRLFLAPPPSTHLMKTPTDRWGAWVDAASEENMVQFKFLQDNIIPELRKEGFAVPAQRSLESVLTQGLDELPLQDLKQHKGVRMCAFEHVMNLLWFPILEHIDSLADEASPGWTEQLGLHQSAILSEMAGTVGAAGEPMDMDDWVEYLTSTLHKHLQVQVPKRLVMEVMSPIVPMHLDATPSNALHMLRSSLCAKLVGPALAAQMNRLILAEIADVPVKSFTEASLNLKVRQDLVTSLEHQHCGPEGDESEDMRPRKKLRRDASSLATNQKGKTAQVVFMIENRVAATRVNATLDGAHNLMKNMSSEALDPTRNISEDLISRWNLVRHMLLLDGAVDRVMSESLLNLREQGRFAGVALVTDESPPSQPRFRGLRFQITVLFWGTFPDVSLWSTCQEPPITRSTCLADIVHCPGKKGVDVSRVIEKQLARVGLNSFDVVAGTGDGGGENEGQHGVHAYFENLNPGYVRRRCLPHISWRTCDVAIRVSGLDYKALAAYFVEGITWSRLRELATRDPADGGLGLFRDGSQRCKDIFGRSPSAIIDTRPETDLNFLKLLAGKEHILHMLATRDLEERKLSADTRAAILNLGDLKNRIRRRILQEILERAMFLLHIGASCGSF